MMKNFMLKPILCLCLLAFPLLQAEEILIGPSVNSQEQVQEALILAKPGDTINLEEGLYQFEDGLSLDIDNVTIIGAGMDKTVLSFADQKSGAQGLLVTSDGVILKNSYKKL